MTDTRQGEWSGWSGFPRVPGPARVLTAATVDQALADAQTSVLPRGLGRSYGDVALNSRGCLLLTERLNRVLAFDVASGVLRAEAGLSLAELIDHVVPRGWFPAVVPGTRWVSLGGAVANDVHGKNHLSRGSFGCHVRRLALQRTGEGVILCSPDQNGDLFQATIGGLGLTGLIHWVELQLQPLASTAMVQQVTPVADFDALLAELRDPEPAWPYRVAWLDGTAPAKHLGRGLVMRADHAADAGRLFLPKGFTRPPRLLPLPPFWATGAGTGWFNQLYRQRHTLFGRRKRTELAAVFFPLDGVFDVRRLYGRHYSFFQFQCVVPYARAGDLLALIAQAREQCQIPRLCTVKVFGEGAAPGLLSFPMPGVSLAMDFPFVGENTPRCYQALANKVYAWGGRLYPAKDALAETTGFWSNQPNLSRFMPWLDPGFASSFWLRTRPSGG
ncbi:FAD-binding oxidoreductase [Acanthopleuribacter pedis]|uniref:FAD-binding oxidoreductase n=1 Tax=Acanthopleuribacter pedis TaxID=442870 RepID=A0A8J7U239_9BACT|nr:FAD-binding oxidoreductase [Acanthopleuribacter pedis]MBO1316888.1 FAD-binding oxidoreductase [Acanthopleuribacter pedis]